MQRSTDILTMK